jgi:hypothetical protein
MAGTAPSEDELLSVHAALLEGCRMELALACRGGPPANVALVVLPHGSPEAQVAFGSPAEVARELAALAEEEGPAAVGLGRAGADLLGMGPVAEGKLRCVVVALGRARVHAIEWPRPAPPGVDA